MNGKRFVRLRFFSAPCKLSSPLVFIAVCTYVAYHLQGQSTFEQLSPRTWPKRRYTGSRTALRQAAHRVQHPLVQYSHLVMLTPQSNLFPAYDTLLIYWESPTTRMWVDLLASFCVSFNVPPMPL